MFKTNQYFNGNVASIAFQGDQLPATVGVMAPGSYEFPTSQKETMSVISGAMEVQLPGATEWVTYAAGDSFVVDADQSFKLNIEKDTAYLCTYQ